MFYIRCTITHQDGRTVTLEGKDHEACEKKALKILKAAPGEIKSEATHRTPEVRRGCTKPKVFLTWDEFDAYEEERIKDIKQRRANGLI